MISWSWTFDRGTLLVGKFSRENETYKPPVEQKVASFDLVSSYMLTVEVFHVNLLISGLDTYKH